MHEERYGIHYLGSKFWLIFWILIFFPIAIVLFATKARAMSHGSETRFEYKGSKFWLYFWALFFFPITFFLFFFNGSIVKKRS